MLGGIPHFKETFITHFSTFTAIVFVPALVFVFTFLEKSFGMLRLSRAAGSSRTQVGIELGTSGLRVQPDNHYTTATVRWRDCRYLKYYNFRNRVATRIQHRS